MIEQNIWSLSQPQIDNIIGTVIGGICLTAILFIIYEYIIPSPNIMGNWILDVQVSNSKANKYKGLNLQFHVLIFQIGSSVKGTGEKIEETDSTGYTHKYIGDKRNRIEIEGVLNRNSSIHTLKFHRWNKKYSGLFYSTDADSNGTSKLSRL